MEYISPRKVRSGSTVRFEGVRVRVGGTQATRPHAQDFMCPRKSENTKNSKTKTYLLICGRGEGKGEMGGRWEEGRRRGNCKNANRTP